LQTLAYELFMFVSSHFTCICCAAAACTAAASLGCSFDVGDSFTSVVVVLSCCFALLRAYFAQKPCSTIVLVLGEDEHDPRIACRHTKITF
jgi:hypothetical protein